MKSQKMKLIAILGPTSSGKTSLAVSLCQKFHGEIISADSRQVYIGMDLGTGKEGKLTKVDLPNLPNQPARLINNIPQYLIDIISPKENFTLANFLSLAPPIIQFIHDQGKIPFLVGGTNLYIKALTEGYQPPISNKKELTIRRRLEKKPLAELLKQLKKLDPQTFSSIDQKNPRRITRALSATLASNIPFSKQRTKTESPYQTLYLAINTPREKLYQKIDQRVDDRISKGLTKEVDHLLKSGISPKRLISLGLEYRFITLYLTGEIKSKEEMLQKLKFAIHNYARRQLVWLRNQLPVIWIKSTQEAEKEISKFF